MRKESSLEEKRERSLVSYKLTLDGGLMREYSLAPAVATLKAWQAEKKIEIFETDRPDVTDTPQSGWPGARATPVEKPWGAKRRPPPKNPAAASMFGRMSAVLFPMRDTHKLSISEINDVSHLVRHLTLGRTIFVTRNAASFIEQGKREKLRSIFQVSVLTPEETVAYLSKEEGWKVGA